MNEKKVVFYADDDADDRDIMSEVFRDYDEVTLKTFGTAVDMISAAKEIDPARLCLAIIDVNMPLMLGTDSIEPLRSIPKLEHLPIVIYSNIEFGIDKAKLFEANVLYVKKPLTYADTLDTARKFVELCLAYAGVQRC